MILTFVCVCVCYNQRFIKIILRNLCERYLVSYQLKGEDNQLKSNWTSDVATS